MARTGAVLFGAAALVTVLGVVLPHQPQIDTDGLLLVAIGSGAMAAILAIGGERLPAWTVHVWLAWGTMLVSFALLFNGERHGGAAGGDEMYYLWVVLLAAYFVGRAGTAGQVGLIAACYTATLIAIDPGPIAVSRWLTTVGLAIGSAVVVRLLSERVERLLAELRLAASTDPLTGLPNRRAFEERLTQELARARRTDLSFGLVLADVDHFKQLNDRHGHAAGDEALIELGRLLQHEMRAVDTVARIGGDEFAILLPATDAGGAAEAAARLVDLVHDHPAIPAVSAGSAAYGDSDGRTIDDLMRAADARLYASKRRSEPRGAVAR
jgi:diguanylate cyclase (GGDEF)-like protein